MLPQGHRRTLPQAGHRKRLQTDRRARLKFRVRSVADAGSDLSHCISILSVSFPVSEDRIYVALSVRPKARHCFSRYFIGARLRLFERAS